MRKPSEHMLPASVFLIVVIVTLIGFLAFESQITGNVAIVVQGGNIMHINISASEDSTYWVGLYGNITQNGTTQVNLTPGFIMNINLTYTNNLTNKTIILATNQTSPTWSNITIANHSDVNTYLNVLSSNQYSSENTFRTSYNFTIENTTYELLAARVNSISGDYYTGVFLTQSHVAFITNAVLNGTAYNGEPAHYQMLLPIPANSSMNYAFTLAENDQALTAPPGGTLNCSAPINLTASLGSDNSTINISWDPITGVTQYQIYYINEETNGSLDFSNATVVNNGVNTYWLDTQNPQKRYYRIEIDNGGTSCVINQTAGTLVLNLTPDYNLISTPFTPSNATVEETLRSISGDFTTVNEFNNTAKSYNFYVIVGNSVFKNFDTIKPGYGYWVRVTTSTSLRLLGSIANNISQPVSSDYNLLGFPAINNLQNNNTVAYVLSSIDGNYSSVSEFNNTAKSYNFYVIVGNSVFKNFDTIKPGHGYWIRATQTDTLVYQND